MGLYRAVCAWLEAGATAKSGGAESDPKPEGNNFTRAEHAHSYRLLLQFRVRRPNVTA